MSNVNNNKPKTNPPRLSSNIKNNPKPTSTPKTILKRDPAKAEANKIDNERRMREIAEEVSKRSNPKPKKEKKKWYDSVLQTAENIIPSLLPYIPMLFGMGDYTESDMPMKSQKLPDTNTLLAHASKGKAGNEVPYMHSTGDVLRVPHREYIGDVYSTMNSFVTELFRINPGLSNVFEWLAPIAGQYTTFRLGGAVIEFVSTGSEYSNSAGLGYVAVAAQYNSDEPPFDNKDDMLNSQFANMDKPSKSFPTWIECSPSVVGEQPKYVRTGEVADTADLNIYDHCMVTLAVGGNTANNAIIGSLYITYDVELLLPRPKGSSLIDLAEYAINDVSDTAPLGTNPFSPVKRPTTTMPLTFINVSNQAYFPKSKRKGRYLVVIRFDSENPVPSVLLPTPTAINCTLYNTFQALIGNGSTGGQYNAVVFYLDLSTNQTPNPAGFELTTPCAIADGSATAFLVVTQLPHFYPSSIDHIFDYHGRNRQERYDNFINIFKSVPEPQWTDATPNKMIKFKLEKKITPTGIFYSVLDDNKRLNLSEKMFISINNSADPDSMLKKYFALEVL